MTPVAALRADVAGAALRTTVFIALRADVDSGRAAALTVRRWAVALRAVDVVEFVAIGVTADVR